MKTNHHLRLSAMGAAALWAVCIPFGSAADLPAGYAPLEYISTDGSAKPYINTEYLPTSNTKIAIDMAYLGAGGTDAWIPIWGYRKTYNSDQYAFFVSNDGAQFALNYKTTDTKSTSGVSRGERFIFRNDNARHYVTRLDQNEAETCILDAADQTFTAGSGWTVTIFGMRGTSVSTIDCRKVKMRLYGFKIWEDSSLVRDFVPVRRESDSAIGLFDVASVDGAFYANAGTGSLAAGPRLIYDCLDIVGSPNEYGMPTPAYGRVDHLSADAVLPVSCPAVYTNQDATLRAFCTGWKLYDEEGDLIDSGAENAFTYVHPSSAYRRLEWQWRTERLRYVVKIGDVPPCYTNISVSLSCADPADDQGGGLYIPGAQLTLSITDPDGRFSAWCGVLPEGVDATSRTITWTVTSDAEIYPRLDGWVFPDRADAISSWYVDFATGSNANDGRSWATPVADFSNVLARARADYTATQRKQYVFVPSKPGVTQTVPYTYTIATQNPTVCLFTLDFPCVIQGAGTRENVVLGLSNYPYPRESGTYRAGLFKIAHIDAAMRNLTLTGYQRGKYQYPLRVTAGMLDNCVFGPNLFGSFDGLLAPLVVEGGVVTNCVVTGNDCYTASGRAMNSSGIYLAGSGVVTHTVVSSNTCSGGAYGGGVYMVGGTLRNSLVYGNKALSNASGVYANPTTACLIENCTIACNEAKAGAANSIFGLRAHGSSATQKTIVRNTIVYGNTVTAGVATNLYRNSATYVELYNNLSTESFVDSATTAANIVADPRFCDAGAADFRPRISPAVDAGQAQEWVATGTDLASGPRVRDARVDIGAYEYVPLLTITAVPGEYASPSPAYGTMHIPSGTSLAVSCPPVWTNAAATHVATCTGWKLFSDPEGTLLASGEGTAFTYVQPALTDCRLEWQWQYRRATCQVTIGDVAPCYTNVTVSLSCANPADDLGGGLFSPGAQLTLSITDPDGRFSDWYGILPEGVDATSRTISWTAASDAEIYPRLDGWVFTDRTADITSWYIDVATGSNANDGHSWATPVADFSNVLARARANYTATQRKQYVFVPDKPGVTQKVPYTYTIATTTQTICLFTLDFPCVIQGAGRRENVRLGLSNYPYPRESGTYRAGLFKIAHIDAAMRNLTLTGYQRGKYQYPLRITAGTFDNCVFGPNFLGSYDGFLAPVVVQGGVVTNCLVTENSGYTANSSYVMNAVGIYIGGGGLVTHTVVCSNTCSGGAFGGGVYMAGGTLRNSLVYGNEAIRYASGVYANPAASSVSLIENCTIADNKTKSGTSYAVYGLRANGSSATQKTIVRNTIAYGNTDVNGVDANLYRNSATYVELYNNLATESFADSATTSGNVIADPRFTDAAAHDYTTAFSAATDAGQARDWMTAGTDLACGPRIRGAAVDIGAYEHIPSAELDASCTVATLLPAPGVPTRLSAAAAGGTAPYTYRWLIDGAVIAEGADKATYDYVFPGGNHTVSLVVTDAAGASVVREGGGVVTVYVPETYVAMDGSNTDPYDTPAKAARNVNDAFNLTAAGGTVHVLPGDYALGAQLNYSRANVAVRSTEGPQRTILTVAPGVAAVKFASAGAVLDGITLQGFNATAVTYFSNGGLVTNCVIRRGSAMAVNIGASGTLADTTVEGVTNSAQVLYQQTNQGGSGSAMIHHCRFLDNCSTANYVFHFFNSGVTVRNCLFVRNRASKNLLLRFHSTQLSNPLLESCTFADNAATGWASVERNTSAYPIYFRNNVWAGNKTTAGAVMAIGAGGWLIANNCVVDARNDTTGTWTDVATDDPGLKRDYSPRSDSPCIDKGLHQSWMDKALDLSGNPRILHKAVDIGAFEWRQTGTILSLR
ncbi:MAG: hypothetical protein IJK04_10160 [Kiritimatiellae bacterium]|nr:hypothetical protein [Kiritimatiellia bacterium]